MFTHNKKRLYFTICLLLLFIDRGQAGKSENVGLILPNDVLPIRAEDFDGADPCLHDTEGAINFCSRKYGVLNPKTGAMERPCVLHESAIDGLKKARKYLKEANPNLELLVISSYRPAGHQQCLHYNGGSCNSAVCGPRDPKTGASLPCKEYDLGDPKYAHIYDKCPHVNYRTVDVCAYDKTKVPLNQYNQIDLDNVDDCRQAGKPGVKQEPGHIYHPCCCRFTSYTSDMRSGSARARKMFGNGPVEAQMEMMSALKKAGWVDNVANEWWHFQYRGN